MARPEAKALLTPAEFRQLGQALYGNHWKTSLARALRMSDRHMRSLAAGEHPVHEGIVVDLIDLCEKKRVKLRTLSDRVAEKIAKSQVRGPTPVSP